MNVVFCINRLGLIGLGVTLSSLIRNCSNTNKVMFWFLCANLTDKEKTQIIRLLKTENFCGSYRLIDFDPFATFGSFPSLHGDWTPYGRLLIADLINEDQVLYLDSDLAVELDILALEKFDFKGNLLAAVGGGKYKYALGHKFYIEKLGLSPDADYFNSGVLLLNLQEWRAGSFTNKCLQIAKQYPLDLPSHDQSLLNIICAGNFAKLPQTFNCQWLAHETKPDASGNTILHFVGSPKPWDPLGVFIHKGYRVWASYLDPQWASSFVHLTFADLERAWKIRRSYFRCMRDKMIQRFAHS